VTALGEACAILFYFIMKKCKKRNHSPSLSSNMESTHTESLFQPPAVQKKFNYMLLIFPAVCLQLETLCKCIGALIFPASIVQMLSGTNIVYSALLTVFYLKKKLYRHHFLAIGLIVSGVIIVGLDCILYDKHEEFKKLSNTKVMLGILQL
jgi:drug/metabolite transporter (DMT)-like permease